MSMRRRVNTVRVAASQLFALVRAQMAADRTNERRPIDDDDGRYRRTLLLRIYTDGARQHGLRSRRADQPCRRAGLLATP